MEFAEEMNRLEGGRIGGGEMGDQARLRRRKVENHRGFIRRLNRHPLPGDERVIFRRLVDFRVEHEIIIPEFHIR